MRISVLAILAIATVTGAGPVRAQVFDRDHPVCLHVYGPVGYYDCAYTSLAQCTATASGRPADCQINPYFANAREMPEVGHVRHRRR